MSVLLSPSGIGVVVGGLGSMDWIVLFMVTRGRFSSSA